MNFNNTEIEIAKKLHDLNLDWHPQVGCYVYDLTGMIEKPSPFQDRVYFILDMKHFLRRAGSVDAVKEAMCWLPVWEDCRRILKHLEVPWDRIKTELIKQSAFEHDNERQVLYEMIHDAMKTQQREIKMA